ncbi:hypothetical protein OVA14_03360 [Agrococcus sp. SL85]|uniref:hypothetical protein n=1 Tax=Agrococcus sp. SL85 TaxID=2995141 RepID=UPI00226CFF3B|nr:hypothetical protein [Agrococcus sp. SL85]WAC66820.1 hypothetical protein OVA14_03360 [Agrococcus sp. SL85]
MRRGWVVVLAVLIVLVGAAALVLRGGGPETPAGWIPAILEASPFVLLASLLLGFFDLGATTMVERGQAARLRRRMGDDARLALVPPREGRPPGLGSWTFDAVAGELARLVALRGLDLEVRRTRRRLRIARPGGAAGVDLVHDGSYRCQRIEIGDDPAVRAEIDDLLRTVGRTAAWGFDVLPLS